MSDARTTALSPEDEAELLGQVDGAIAVGLEACRWWQAREAAGTFPDLFPLMRDRNPPELSYGFFGEIPAFPLMGMVQRMAFDTTKSGPPSATRDQMREFILRYFMRVSDFSRPTAFVPEKHAPASRLLQPLSWCTDPSVQLSGFGFEQLFCKHAGGGPICRIPPKDRHHIVDLREIGPTYDWVLMRVQIYDFVVHFRPLGYDSPGVEVPLPEANYLLVTPHFVLDDPNPSAGAIGRFGMGYTLLKNPGPPGFLAYGPGHFRGGFQNFEFVVREDGSTDVRMVFVVDRPERIVNVLADPVEWSVVLANLFSLGLFSGVLEPWRQRLAKRSTRVADVDPVLGYIELADMITGGYSRDRLCIDKRQLEVDFMVQHFVQHYQLITGALSTWSQVNDWTNPATVPPWVEEGAVLA